MSSQEDLNINDNNLHKNTAGAQIKVGIQYLKDLSVENANSPYIFNLNSSQPPKLDINYNVSVVRFENSEPSDVSSFEVVLETKVSSALTDEETKEEKTLFICEVKYAGCFSIEGGSEEEQQRILFIYAPTILFPYARQIISTSTGSCGFPPLMLDPIDFAAHYDNQKPQD